MPTLQCLDSQACVLSSAAVGHSAPQVERLYKAALELIRQLSALLPALPPSCAMPASAHFTQPARYQYPLPDSTRLPLLQPPSGPLGSPPIEWEDTMATSPAAQLAAACLADTTVLSKGLGAGAEGMDADRRMGHVWMPLLMRSLPALLPSVAQRPADGQLLLAAVLAHLTRVPEAAADPAWAVALSAESAYPLISHLPLQHLAPLLLAASRQAAQRAQRTHSGQGSSDSLPCPNFLLAMQLAPLTSKALQAHTVKSLSQAVSAHLCCRKI